VDVFGARPTGTPAAVKEPSTPNRSVERRDCSRGFHDEPCRAEVRARFRRLRATGDATVREQLIIDHRWIATQCASRFRYRGEPELDLVQVAMLGLVKATDRYDPEREVPFHAFAIPTILGELKRHFRDTTWAISVPRSAKDLMPRLRAATEVLDQRLGRSPTIDELAAELRVDREVVIAGLEARGANRMKTLSEPDAANVQTFGWANGDMTAEIEDRLAALDALSHLDERSRKIMVWRFYEELTQREIGERLGIGQVQVSRLLRSALQRLRTESAQGSASESAE
jgi:RNA polymerase sigma-B factor